MSTDAHITRDIVYFDRPGPANTDEALSLALTRARLLGIRSIIVATTRGETGLKAAERFKDFNLIVITHSTGFEKPDEQQLDDGLRQKMVVLGANLLTAQHAFGGVGRAVRKKLGTYELEELIAFTLRIFGQGTKVACEMALMAADAGLVRTDEKCIAIGGTGRGADTAIVLQPTNAQTFFDMKINEIICKPML